MSLGVIPMIIEMALYRTLLYYTLPYWHAYQYARIVRKHCEQDARASYRNEYQYFVCIWIVPKRIFLNDIHDVLLVRKGVVSWAPRGDIYTMRHPKFEIPYCLCWGLQKHIDKLLTGFGPNKICCFCLVVYTWARRVTLDIVDGIRFLKAHSVFPNSTLRTCSSFGVAEVISLIPISVSLLYLFL